MNNKLQEVTSLISSSQLFQDSSFRPVIPHMKEDSSSVFHALTRIITDCWQEDPNKRPDFSKIYDSLQEISLLLLQNEL